MAIPNLSLEARTNMVEMKKNKTVNWLDGLTSEKQSEVLNIAVKCRTKVAKERLQDKKELKEKLIQQTHTRTMALVKKAKDRKR